MINYQSIGLWQLWLLSLTPEYHIWQWSNPCNLQCLLCNIFLSAKATYAAIAETYSYLTPDLWKETVFTKSPYQAWLDLYFDFSFMWLTFILIFIFFRSSQTSLPRTTAPRVFRSRRPGPTSQLTLDALEDEDVKTSVLFSRLTSSSAQGYLFVIFLSFSGQLKIRS